MAARIRPSPPFTVESRTRVLANVRYQRALCCASNYDVMPDGSGFIMAVADSSGGRTRMILVEGLLERLRAVVGR